MKIVECEQGTAEWLAVRAGIPTASRFHKILTPKTLVVSSQAEGIMHHLLAEWLLGEPIETQATPFMERGEALETEARQWYQLTNDVTVREVGFVTTDDGLAGCSPDGLIGEDGGLEIKCPGAIGHVAALLDSGAEHVLQVQGALWITGREWWDLLSYNPVIMPHCRRVYRDEKVIEAIAEAIPEFVARMDDARDKLTELGCRPITRPAGAVCTAHREDGRWCLRRDGLTEVGGRWLCPDHASQNEMALNVNDNLAVFLSETVH